MDKDHVGNRAIETPATTVRFKDGILIIVSKGLQSTSESVTATIAAAREISGDSRHPVLFDARRWPGGAPGGWMAVIEHMRTTFSAGAVVVDSSLYEGIKDRMDGFSMLLIPLGVFTDIDEAGAFLAPYVGGRADSL